MYGCRYDRTNGQAETVPFVNVDTGAVLSIGRQKTASRGATWLRAGGAFFLLFPLVHPGLPAREFRRDVFFVVPGAVPLRNREQSTPRNPLLKVARRLAVGLCVLAAFRGTGGVLLLPVLERLEIEFRIPDVAAFTPKPSVVARRLRNFRTRQIPQSRTGNIPDDCQGERGRERDGGSDDAVVCRFSSHGFGSFITKYYESDRGQSIYLSGCRDFFGGAALFSLQVVCES